MNTKEMEAEIKTLKEEFDWLNDSSAVALQQSRIDLQRAFTNFFKGCKGKYKQKYGYPKFKSRHSQISFRVPSNNGKVAIQDKNLKIPKIGLVKIKTRHMPEFLKLTSATVIIEPSGKVYASLTVEKYVTQKTQTGENAGIDLGLESFITLSNGIKIPPFNYAKSNRNKIASMDRKLSKMRDKLKKVSIDYENASNYQAYKKKVAKYKTHIANKRKDALNKLTTQLVTKYDFIAVEDLNVKGMSKNHRLAYAIQDASW
jgi:putative transposase